MPSLPKHKILWRHLFRGKIDGMFPVMKRLLHIFSLFLFRCNQADDFEPAKILMNMCFTFFLEVNKG